MARFSFRVSFTAPNVPRGNRLAAMRYVADAVSGWKGQFNPGTAEENFEDEDPFWQLEKVEVRDPVSGSIWKD